MVRNTPVFQRTLICSALGVVLAATANAQDAAPKRASSALLEEVVVTARKREEALKTYLFQSVRTAPTKLTRSKCVI